MLSSSGRGDPRVVRTRKLLASALLSLIEEKNFQEITVQDITLRASVNRATFYAHFSDKYAMVTDLFGELFVQLLARRQADLAGSPQEYFGSLLLTLTDHYGALDSQCRQVFRLFESPLELQIVAQLHENIRAWLAAQPGAQRRPAAQLDLAATLISWASFGAAREWSARRRSQPAEELVGATVPMLLGLLGTLDERAA